MVFPRAPLPPCMTSAVPDVTANAVLDSFSAVQAPLSTLNSLVAGWNSNSGYSSGSSIIDSFAPLRNSLTDLGSAVAAVPPIDSNNVIVYVTALNTLVSGIVQLLNLYTAEANDFNAVGLKEYVMGDIYQMADPLSSIEAGLFAAFPPTIACNDMTSASIIASSLSYGYSEACDVYTNLQNLIFLPTAPALCASYCSHSVSTTFDSSSSIASAASSASDTSSLPETSSSLESSSSLETSSSFESSGSFRSSGFPEFPTSFGYSSSPTASDHPTTSNAPVTSTFSSFPASSGNPLTSPATSASSATPDTSATSTATSVITGYSSTTTTGAPTGSPLPPAEASAMSVAQNAADALQDAIETATDPDQLLDPFRNLEVALDATTFAIESGGLLSPGQVATAVGMYGALVTTMVSLLQSLVSRVSTLNKHGPASFDVGQGLKVLTDYVIRYESALFNSFPTDAPCPPLAAAAEYSASLVTAFNSAATAYDVTLPEFPTPPLCTSGSASGTTASSSFSNISNGSGAFSVSGTSGTSDASGASGASGAFGASGASGASGIPGTSGAPNASGISGASNTPTAFDASGASPTPSTASGSYSAAGSADSIESTVTTVVTAYTTYCPTPTTFCVNEKCYTVTEATTLTITDCPCTLTTVVTDFVTYCPTPGTFTYGDATYTVTAPTLITIRESTQLSDAPYSPTGTATAGLVSPSAGPAPGGPTSPNGSPSESAPAAITGPTTPAVAPSNSATVRGFSVFAAVAAAAVAMFA